MPTPDYYVSDEGPSYSAAWGLAHERTAREDEERSRMLAEQIRRDMEAERARQTDKGGRPRTNPETCDRCDRRVYARALCREHYRAELGERRTKPKPTLRKLTDAQVIRVRVARSEGMSLKQIALRFGVAKGVAQAICEGRTYREVA